MRSVFPAQAAKLPSRSLSPQRQLSRKSRAKSVLQQPSPLHSLLLPLLVPAPSLSCTGAMKLANVRHQGWSRSKVHALLVTGRVVFVAAPGPLTDASTPTQSSRVAPTRFSETPLAPREAPPKPFLFRPPPAGICSNHHLLIRRGRYCHHECYLVLEVRVVPSWLAAGCPPRTETWRRVRPDNHRSRLGGTSPGGYQPLPRLPAVPKRPTSGVWGWRRNDGLGCTCHRHLQSVGRCS